MKDLSAVVALELVHVVGHLLGLLVPVPVVSLHFLLQTEKLKLSNFGKSKSRFLVLNLFKVWDYFFVLVFGLSQLTSLQFILYHLAGLRKLLSLKFFLRLI
jgi:hypothetical protein